MPNVLIRIRSAPRRALPLRRAERVEVVELAAGEESAAPLAVLFMVGILGSPLDGGRLPLSRALRPPLMSGPPLVRGVDNYLRRRRASGSAVGTQRVPRRWSEMILCIF